MDIKELFLSLSNNEKQDFLDFATSWLEEWTGPMKDPDGDDNYVARADIAKDLVDTAKEVVEDARVDRSYQFLADDDFSPTPEGTAVYHSYFGSAQNPERSITDSNKLYGSLHAELDDEEKAALQDIINKLSPKYGA